MAYVPKVEAYEFARILDELENHRWSPPSSTA